MTTAHTLVATEWRRLGLSLGLLLEQRVITVILVDVFVLLNALIQALVSNMSPGTVYVAVVLVPVVLLGVPILSNAVALERRAGSLELVLASATAHAHFARRFLSLGAVLAAQGWAFLILARVLPGPSFVLFPLLIQTLSVCLLLCAVVFYWSLRLRGSGPVIFASLVTLVLLGRWFFSVPEPVDDTPFLEFLAGWFGTNLALLSAALLFYLYGRRRLARTERLVS